MKITDEHIQLFNAHYAVDATRQDIAYLVGQGVIWYDHMMGRHAGCVVMIKEYFDRKSGSKEVQKSNS